MNVTAILVAALVVGGVGILIGFFLGISGEKFKVEVDEKEVAILGELWWLWLCRMFRTCCSDRKR